MKKKIKRIRRYVTKKGILIERKVGNYLAAIETSRSRSVLQIWTTISGENPYPNWGISRPS